MRKLLTVAAVCGLVTASWTAASARSAELGRAPLAGSHAKWATAANRVGDVGTARSPCACHLHGRDDAGLEAVAARGVRSEQHDLRWFLTPADLQAASGPRNRRSTPCAAGSAPTGCRCSTNQPTTRTSRRSVHPARSGDVRGSPRPVPRARACSCAPPTADVPLPSSIASARVERHRRRPIGVVAAADHISAAPMLPRTRSSQPGSATRGRAPRTGARSSTPPTPPTAAVSRQPVRTRRAATSRRQLRSGLRHRHRCVDSGLDGRSGDRRDRRRLRLAHDLQGRLDLRQAQRPGPPAARVQFSQLIFTPNKPLEGPTSATPTAGTARRPSTSRPCTPWRRAPTSSSWAAPTAPTSRWTWR